MNYQLLYEFKGEPIFDPLTGISLFFVLLSIIAIFFRKKIKFFSGLKFGLMVLVLGLAPAVTATFTIFTRVRGNSIVTEMLSSGSHETVEGYIENFDPTTKNGKKKESFELKGVYFEYSDYINVPGYHKTTLMGGVIKEGEYFRIGYYTKNEVNFIIKIESGR